MEANEIKILVDNTNELDLLDLAFLKSQENGENIIERLTANQVIEIINEFVETVREANESNELYAFPRYFTRRDNQSNLDILSCIQKIVNLIRKKNNPGGIETWALFLKNYIHSVGLYDLALKNERPDALSDVKKLRTENKALNKELHASLKSQKTLTSQIENLKNDLELFKSSKEKELTQITNNLNSTNQTKVQIDETLNKVTATKSEIDKTTARIDASFEAFEEDIKGYMSNVTDLEKRLQTNDKKLESILKSQGDETERIKKLNDSSEKINAELVKLLNPAIAKDLQHTFNQRKTWLFWSTIVWLVLTMAITVFLGWYVYQLFESKAFSFELEKVIVAGIKLTPIVTILYFAIRQFSKTRNLEEEYAFRETVATSLMAYAAEIKSDESRKEELIRETVNKLYESPTKSVSKSSSKKENESDVNSLIELLKQLKNFGT